MTRQMRRTDHSVPDLGVLKFSDVVRTVQRNVSIQMFEMNRGDVRDMSVSLVDNVKDSTDGLDALGFELVALDGAYDFDGGCHSSRYGAKV